VLTTIDEGIYAREKRTTLGSGATAKQQVSRTLWFPLKEDEGLVEILLVTDNRQQLLNLKERVTTATFRSEYRLEADSGDVYRRLRETLSSS